MDSLVRSNAVLELSADLVDLMLAHWCDPDGCDFTFTSSNAVEVGIQHKQSRKTADARALPKEIRDPDSAPLIPPASAASDILFREK